MGSERRRFRDSVFGQPLIVACLMCWIGCVAAAITTDFAWSWLAAAIGWQVATISATRLWEASGGG
jgi:hypothetical protein